MMRDTVRSTRPIGRRHTPARLEYLAIANQAVIGSVSRGQLSVLAQALPCLGLINATEAHLLSVLINTAHNDAFVPRGKPVVFKSNNQLAFEISRSPGRVSRLLAKLFDLGLITMQDSGNYKRHPVKAGHEIVDACGIDLRILIHRYDELWSAVQDARSKQAARVTAQRRFRGAVRNMILAVQNWPDRGDKNAHRVKARFDRICAIIKRLGDAPAQTLRRASALIARLQEALIDRRFSSKMTSSNVENDMHILITNPNQISKSNDERRSANADQHDSSADIASEKEAYEKSLFADQPRCNPKTETIAVSRQNAATRDSGNAQPLAALADLVDAIRPALLEWGLKTPDSWADLSRLSPQMCRIAGISEHARAAAVAEMGDQAAAVAVALTLSKLTVQAVKSPGGYLRAMTDRAAAGSLNLRASIFGLAAQNRLQ